MLRLIYNFIITVYLFSVTNSLFAYQDFLRHGYSHCQSCHVSPHGGGALTSYGKGAAREFSAIFRGLEDPGLPFGADLKYIYFETDDRKDDFFMEKSVYYHLELDKYFSGYVSGGQYGKQDRQEVREAWIKFNYEDFLQLRVGRYLRPYNSNFFDHTLLTTKIGQGRETSNVELVLAAKFFKFSVLRFYPKIGRIEAREDRAVFAYEKDDPNRGMGYHLEAYPVRFLRLGLSYQDYDDENIEDLLGAHGMLAVGKFIYLGGELAKGKENPEMDSIALVGVEPLRGITIQYQHEKSELRKQERDGLQLRIIPVFGFEYILKYYHDPYVLMIMGHLWF